MQWHITASEKNDISFNSKLLMRPLLVKTFIHCSFNHFLRYFSINLHLHTYTYLIYVWEYTFVLRVYVQIQCRPACRITPILVFWRLIRANLIPENIHLISAISKLIKQKKYNMSRFCVLYIYTSGRKIL